MEVPAIHASSHGRGWAAGAARRKRKVKRGRQARQGRARVPPPSGCACCIAYPLIEGHTLVIPKRHVASLFELDPGEQADVWILVGKVRAELEASHEPEGFTVGVRLVREARATYDGRLGRMQRSDEWSAILGDVDATVRKMLLWKLQTVGSERVEFLYESRGTRIRGRSC